MLVVGVNVWLKCLLNLVVDVNCFFYGSFFLLAVRNVLDAKMNYLSSFLTDVLTLIVKSFKQEHKIRSGPKQLIEGNDWQLFSKLSKDHNSSVLAHVCIVWLLIYLQPIDRFLKGFFNVFCCDVSSAFSKVAQTL